MRERGFDPKAFERSKTREVRTAKGDLLEFLNFFSVDVYRSGPAPDVVVVDVEALRAAYNPGPSDVAVGEQAPTLSELFEAASIRLQAELVVGFIDRAAARG